MTRSLSKVLAPLFFVICFTAGSLAQSASPEAITASPIALAQAASGKAHKTGKAEQQIRRLMAELDEAHRRSDATAFDRIWADDYVLTDWRGVVKNRTEALAEWRAGEHQYESYQSDDMRIRFYGDTAIVTARVIRKSGSDAENIGRFRHTRVFVRQNGRWRLVATQVTRIAQQ